MHSPLSAPVVHLLAVTVGLALGQGPAASAQSANTSTSLQSLISASLQPLAINFLPAHSNVFFLPPNQTQSNRQFAFAPSVVSQPKLVIVPNGLINSFEAAPVSVPQNAATAAAVSTKLEVPHTLSSSSASLHNSTLLLQNPFASTPYQSNGDIINSLIKNIFSNFSLQSLPPEDILFGALPSGNSTITRTFVENVFENNPTEVVATTENPLPFEFEAVSDIRHQPDSEPDANLIGQGSPAFEEIVRTDNGWNTESPPFAVDDTLPPATENPVTETVIETVTVGQPALGGEELVTNSPLAPVTVTPVAPTVGADFESNRIEPVQIWQPPAQIRPAEAPHAPPRRILVAPPTVRPVPVISTPISPAIISAQTKPLPINPSKIVKVLKPTKLIDQLTKLSHHRSKQIHPKIFQTQLPIFYEKQLFSFELNNKKIVGKLGGETNQNKPAQISVSRPTPLVQVLPKSVPQIPRLLQLSRSVKPHRTPVAPAKLELPLGQDISVSDKSGSSKKWQPISVAGRSQERSFGSHEHLVNIISLPNYKFYLGKRT